MLSTLLRAAQGRCEAPRTTAQHLTAAHGSGPNNRTTTRNRIPRIEDRHFKRRPAKSIIVGDTSSVPENEVAMPFPDFTHLEGRHATFNDWLNTLMLISVTPFPPSSKSILMMLFISSKSPFGDRILQDSSPSILEISACTGLHRSTVQRHLATLRDEGWIRVTRQGGHDGSPTVYALANLMDFKRGADLTRLNPYG